MLSSWLFLALKLPAGADAPLRPRCMAASQCAATTTTARARCAASTPATPSPARCQLMGQLLMTTKAKGEVPACTAETRSAVLSRNASRIRELASLRAREPRIVAHKSLLGVKTH